MSLVSHYNICKIREKNNKRKKRVAAELTSLSASSYYLVNHTVQRPNATLSISLIIEYENFAKKERA